MENYRYISSRRRPLHTLSYLSGEEGEERPRTVPSGQCVPRFRGERTPRPHSSSRRSRRTAIAGNPSRINNSRHGFGNQAAVGRLRFARLHRGGRIGRRTDWKIASHRRTIEYGFKRPTLLEKAAEMRARRGSL